MVVGTTVTYSNVPGVALEMSAVNAGVGGNSNSGYRNNSINNNNGREEVEVDVLKEVEEEVEEEEEEGAATYAIPRKAPFPPAAAVASAIIDLGDASRPPANPEESANESRTDGDGGNEGGGRKQDREADFGRLVAKGEAEELEEFLKEHQADERFVLGSIATEKIGQELHDLGIKEFPPLISPMDLAILCRKDDSLETLIEHANDTYPSFPNYVRCRSFLNPGLVLEKLCACAVDSDDLDAATKAAEEYLNVRLDSNHDDPEAKGPNEFRLDLSVFHRPDRDPRRRETSSLLPMLPLRPRREEDESEWLLRHPVVDAFVSLRWRQARAAVFFSVLLLICFAIAVTSCFAKYSEVAPTPAGVSGRRRQPTVLRRFLLPLPVRRWLPLALALVLAMAAVLSVMTRSGGFVRWISFLPPSRCLRSRKSSSKFVSLPIPSFRGFVRLLLLLASAAHAANVQFPFSAFVLLLFWAEATMAMARVPMFAHVFCASAAAAGVAFRYGLAFLTSFLGFVFFHRLLEEPELFSHSEDGFGPYTSVTKTLGGLLNHWTEGEQGSDYLHDKSLPSVLLTWVMLVLILAFLFAAAAAASARVKEILRRRDDIELVTKVLEVDDLEALLSIPACLAGKLSVRHLVPDPSQWMVVAKSENDGIFKTFPQAQRGAFHRATDEGLPLILSKIDFSMEDDEEAAKGEKKSQTSQRLTIPRRVWTKSRPIVEDLHEIVRAKMREARAGMEGRQFVQRDLGDYTSLYWDPGTAGDESNCRSENEYEIVGEGMEEEGGGGRKSRGGFRYSSISSCLGGGVRAMRESLLRELRRDLARLLTGGDKGGGLLGGVAGDGSSKSVQVRPGLALGVITLQAGAAAASTSSGTEGGGGGQPKLILQ